MSMEGCRGRHRLGLRIVFDERERVAELVALSLNSLNEIILREMAPQLLNHREALESVLLTVCDPDGASHVLSSLGIATVLLIVLVLTQRRGDAGIPGATRYSGRPPRPRAVGEGFEAPLATPADPHGLAPWVKASRRHSLPRQTPTASRRG